MAKTNRTTSVPASGVSDAEIAAFLDELGVSPRTNLIGLLQDVQERLGWLPPEAVNEISRRTKVLSRIYGVITFYAQFYTQPRGRHNVRACRGTACHVRGAPDVLAEVRRVLGIEEGQSTPDLKYCLETVACLGTCFLAPVMMIDEQYFGKLTPKKIETILGNHRAET